MRKSYIPGSANLHARINVAADRRSSLTFVAPARGERRTRVRPILPNASAVGVTAGKWPRERLPAIKRLITRRRALSAAILSLLCAALAPNVSYAYEIRYNDDCSVALHWPPEQEVSFWLNENGCGDLPFERCEAAVLAAFDAIQSIECTGIRFSYKGTTTTNVFRHYPADTADGINLISWYESWPPESGINETAVASTWSLRNPDGEFIEFGIGLNGETYQWADDLSPETHDIQGVITSQLLYIIGLSYSESEQSILDGVYAYSSDRKRTPLQDDIDGLCFLSPKDPEAEHWNTACPSDQHCEAARCVPGAPPDDAGENPPDSGTAPPQHDAETQLPDAGIAPTKDSSAKSDATKASDSASVDNGNDDLERDTDEDGDSGRMAECQFNSDCVDDRLCVDGKCVDAIDDGDEGCGCRVGRGDAPNPAAVLFLSILLAWLPARRALRGRKP
ncbi:MAG: hypothetical protein JXA30_16400 [Deltaproteobacteria bacterium]|nr:hypothetical protein [Deltaproteobacteria bacterium]